MSEEGVIESSLEALAFEAEPGGMMFEQVQGEAAQDGEVFSAVEHTQASIAVVKDDLERPPLPAQPGQAARVDYA